MIKITARAKFGVGGGTGRTNRNRIVKLRVDEEPSLRINDITGTQERRGTSSTTVRV